MFSILKKTILGLIFLGVQFIWSQTSLLSIGSNEQLSLTGNGTGEYLYINGLSLQPSTSQYIITNNILTTSSTVSPSLNNSASKVYNWNNTLLNFNGNIYFKYDDSEILGLTESELLVYIYNSIDNWNMATSVSSDLTSNIKVSSIVNKNINSIALAAFSIAPLDADGDGVIDSLDNCVNTVNPDQADADGDGVGDVCDNAPNTPNADQRDTDADGIADVEDEDDDNDGVPDTQDDFPIDPNETTDTDGDGQGDNADTDLDNDGVLNNIDNCPSVPNLDQLDTDSDGVGNICDTDDDGDGFTDADEIICGTDPLLTSSKPIDTDGDGIPNCIDTDDDNDGILDAEDEFPSDKDEWTDTDGDGIGNNSDMDDDNDGQADSDEITCGSDPFNKTSLSLDYDQDGVPDCLDSDDDNDGLLDISDAFPFNPSEWADTDKDGTGDNADTDDDNDGQSDHDELQCGSNSLDPTSMASDIDGDGTPDCLDEDIDGDGCSNESDAFPSNARECLDTDGDGVGDNMDVDLDNDGILNIQDVFPLDPNETKDSDGDGIGDNSDLDDNNDGFDDQNLYVSGVLTPKSNGLEETWKIININMYPNARVSVYNKNGQEVFSAQGYRNDWRGTYKNSSDLLPESSYFYMIELYTGKKPITGWLYITY